MSFFGSLPPLAYNSESMKQTFRDRILYIKIDHTYRMHMHANKGKSTLFSLLLLYLRMDIE